MKKIVLIFAVSLVLFSCGKKEGNMIVEGQIKGLKKGKLYLQKMKDTVLVSVDSVALNGSDIFRLSDNVSEPILYYLTFDTNNNEKRVLFFGEQGNITINDNVTNFGIKPEISGSKNQEILEEFNKVMVRFQEQRLDLIKRDFEAKKAGDKELIAGVEADFNKMLKRKALYTANFAVSNSKYEAAPYIALTELYNASIPILDTVNNAFSAEIKNSEYGKRFQEYVDKIKEVEKK